MRARIKWRKWLVNICRFLLAATFLFSGFVKLNDPLGTQYKIEDYGLAFGLSDCLIHPFPLLLSVLLGVVEFCLGAYMCFGIYKCRSTRTILAFMLLYTPLTLYLALTNPISDCGCFGDVWVLTNWQTFSKNLLLLVAAFYTMRYKCSIIRFVTERNQWMLSVYTSLFAMLFAAIHLYQLPLIDFRPYHIGADLLEKMGVKTDDNVELETYFIMQKNGEQREFTLENYPDSTWTFIDSRTEMLGGEYSEPEITDFQIRLVETDQDITEALLMQDGYKFLLISPYLEQADDGIMDRIAVLNDYCMEYGYPLYCLTASGEEGISRWKNLTGSEYPFCHTDAVVLKTMVRSNPGLMLLHGSKVVNKWPSTSLPIEEDLQCKLDELPLAHPNPSGSLIKILGALMWYCIPLLFLTLMDRLWVVFKLRNLHKFEAKSQKKNENK